MSEFTQVEAFTINNGVMNVLGEVSDADQEGLLAMFKEGRAGTKALRDLPEPLRSVVLDQDIIEPDGYVHPAGEDMEGYVAAAIAVIDARTPQLRAEFARVLQAAARAVAEAAKGVSASEQAVLDRLAAALR